MEKELKPLPHQERVAALALPILKLKGYVYINGQPRSGKTLTSILVAEQTNATNIMVLTKKAAIEGWLKFTELASKNYTVINYEQLGKLENRTIKFKYNPEDYQLVIIDESHNIGAFPKPSTRQKIIKIFCSKLPHIHLSGTPIIESACTIYHQMALGRFNPFYTYPSFYNFHREFGILHSIWIRGQQVPQYDKFKPELLDVIKRFTVYMSQADAGIENEVKDEIHYIELDSITKALYNKLLNDKVVKFNETTELIADNTMKLRTALHQLEGGTIKIDDDYIVLPQASKAEYIKQTFGDTEDMGIMCHFLAERTKLRQIFKHAQLFSSNAHAEGVDLSYLKHFIIYSSDYSGARFVQRRERIANINGSNTTTVHHILVKKAISDQVYQMVSKKRDFNNETFVEETI